MNENENSDNNNSGDWIKIIGILASGGVLASVISFALPKLLPDNKPPVAIMKHNTKKGTAPLKILFDGTDSSDPESKALKYKWIINDKIVSEQASFKETFNEAEYYRVVLEVTDDNGFTDDTSTIIEVIPQTETPAEREKDTVYYDSFTITGQNDLNKISKYTKINGNLTIDKTGLKNLDELANLKEIYGNLSIRWNHRLVSLRGLSNLEKVNGSVRFFDNNALHDFSGLNNLKYIGGELHFRWEDMDCFDGFESLSEIGGNFILHDNNAFRDLNGFNKLITIKGDLLIQFNSRMNTINGFTSLRKIGGKLVIQENEALLSTEAYRLKKFLGQRGWSGTTIIQKNG